MRHILFAAACTMVVLVACSTPQILRVDDGPTSPYPCHDFTAQWCPGKTTCCPSGTVCLMAGSAAGMCEDDGTDVYEGMARRRMLRPQTHAPSA